MPNEISPEKRNHPISSSLILPYKTRFTIMPSASQTHPSSNLWQPNIPLKTLPRAARPFKKSYPNGKFLTRDTASAGSIHVAGKCAAAAAGLHIRTKGQAAELRERRGRCASRGAVKSADRAVFHRVARAHLADVSIEARVSLLPPDFYFPKR